MRISRLATASEFTTPAHSTETVSALIPTIQTLNKMKHSSNNYLDAGDAEESASDDLDVREDSRAQGLSRLSVKRRKLAYESEDEAPELSEDELYSSLQKRAASDVGNGEDEMDFPSGRKARTSQTPMNAKSKPLSASELEAAQRKVRKTGVIYLSRVPPFMKPSTLRNLLTPYGTVLRIFLTPEPHSAYIKRKRLGGNSKRAFIDGWIEFASKGRAKTCVETLNGNTIGGKKAGYYRDDLWNMKYLKGFKWDDLMEQVQGERRAREGRLRAEIQRDTRERKAFLGNLEVAKKQRAIDEKRKKREGDEAEPLDARARAEAEVHSERLKETSKERPSRSEMRFRQNEVKDRRPASGEGRHQGDVKRVLGKIF